jgi:alpha-L-rhamnosidase
VPWVLYNRTGDLGVLERQYSSMRGWVDRMSDLAGADLLWTGGFQFGDWLDPTAPPDDPFRAKADPDVLATAHLARGAEILADAARVLGRDDDADRYAALAADVRAAFASAYVTPAGHVLSDAQTVYAAAIEWALLPTAEQRATAGDRLADLVRGSGFRISTGFIGTPLVTDALTSTGHVDVAYRLLLQTGCPSWLYPVTMGATTIWERWDSMLPDGSINPGEMTSFNHYALGAVADWLHRSVAGLAAGAPGYREIVVRPLPTDALTHAEARHVTPYGEARVSWRREGGRFRLDVRVPVGTTARVHVPGAAQPEVVPHGEHRWDVADPTAASPATLPAGATVRDVLDTPALWTEVVTAAVETGIAPAGEAQVAERLTAYLDRPATQLSQALAPRPYRPGARELRERIAAVLGATAPWSRTGS